MRRARLAVENALAAIDAADRPVRRPDHRRDEIAPRAGDVAQRPDLRRLAPDARELDRIGRYRVLRHAVDALNVELALLDGEPPLLVCAVRRDYGRHGLRRIAAETENETP